MKKRSLVSAIAMLVVSAIVLTSATYAWFAGNSQVGVDTISASLQASDGSIMISADSTDWSKTTLVAGDFTKSTDFIADTFQPVSFDGTDTFLAASFPDSGAESSESNKLTVSSKSTTTGYTAFTFYLKSTNANTAVTITPTFTDNTGYGYYLMTIDGVSQGVKSSSANSYYPLIADASTVITDTNRNSIIDADDGEVASYLGTQISAAQSAAVSTTLGTTPVAVTVYMWAEGQDADCTGAAAASAISIGLNIAKTTT